MSLIVVNCCLFINVSCCDHDDNDDCAARMTAMKVLKCTVRDETSTAIFVNNG